MYIKITFYNIKCTKKKGKNLLFDVSATFFVLIIKLESSLQVTLSFLAFIAEFTFDSLFKKEVAQDVKDVALIKIGDTSAMGD